MTADYAQTTSDGGGGFRYEHEMTALVALRLLKEQQFLIASNLKKAGKFDDVVFQYEDKNKQTYSWFVQFKHKNNIEKSKISQSDLNKSNDFALKKYFHSYRDIINQMQGKQSALFDVSMENAIFAIYTNAILHDDVLQRGHELIGVDMLSTNPQHEKNVMFIAEKSPELFNGFNALESSMCQNFLHQFVLCSNQASERNLDDLIQNEIKLIKKGLSTAELTRITLGWIRFIQKWCTGENATYLRKEEALNKFNSLVKDAQQGKKAEVSVRFTDSFLKVIKTEFDKNYKVINYVSDVESSMLAMAALHQVGFTEHPNICLPLQNFGKGDYSVAEGSTLVLDCEGDMLNINIKSVADAIAKLLPKSRVILVSTEDNEAAKKISTLVKAEKKRFYCTLDHISNESRLKLLEREVTFQGLKLKLASLLPPAKRTMDHLFDMASITRLLQGRPLNIGKALQVSSPSFMPRGLGRKVTVRQDVFASADVSGSIALSNITLKEAMVIFPGAIPSTAVTSDSGANKQIIILEGKPEEEFSRIRSVVQSPLHWFEKKAKDEKMWTWKKSSQKIEEILRHLEKVFSFSNFDNLEVQNESIVIVSGEPGMGKTSLLHNLALQTKRKNPSLWIISVPLNDCREILSKNFMENVEEKTKDIITLFAGIKKDSPKFLQRFFDHCYKVSGKMVILLDGFDEITPDYTKEGLALINALKSVSVANLWITTRPNTVGLLEKEMCSLSFSIKPLNPKEARAYLRKYFKENMTNGDDNIANEVVNQIFQVVGVLFDNRVNQLHQVPLQAKMLADIVSEVQDGRLRHDVTSLRIIQEFIRMKREIQREKAKLTSTVSFEQKRLEKMWENDLINLALLSQFPSGTCDSFAPAIDKNDVLQLKEQVADGHEKSGLVLSYDNNIPQFIHNIFAEYFVALFFSRTFEANRKFLSSDEFFSTKFSSVKFFFDRILSFGKELHDSVLNKNVDLVRSLLSSHEVDETDDGGRSALHVAASLPYSGEIISALLDAGAKVDMQDGVLHWKPIQYALKIGAIENIAVLLEKSNETLEVSSVPVTWETLLTAVRGDYPQLFLHLLNNGIYKEVRLDKLGDQKWIGDEVTTGLTILHLAAAYDSVKILKDLLREDSRDSKAWLMDKKDDIGRTPLLLAASRQCSEAAILLLDSGADPLVISEGKNLLELAAEAVDIELLRRLLNNEKIKAVDPLSLMHGALGVMMKKNSDWSSDMIVNLWGQFPGVFSGPAIGTILGQAAAQGNHQLVEYLCSNGAEVNLATDEGYPLILAVSAGCHEVVRVLLDSKDIKVDVSDKAGRTPVYIAVVNGNSQIFKMLVDAGADLNCRTLDGCDLTHAIAHPGSCNSEIFSYLIEKDFNFCKRNANGQNGLQLLHLSKAYELIPALDPSFVPPAVEIAVEKSNVVTEPKTLNDQCSLEEAKKDVKSKKKGKNKKPNVALNANNLVNNVKPMISIPRPLVKIGTTTSAPSVPPPSPKIKVPATQLPDQNGGKPNPQTPVIPPLIAPNLENNAVPIPKLSKAQKKKLFQNYLATLGHVRGPPGNKKPKPPNAANNNQPPQQQKQKQQNNGPKPPVQGKKDKKGNPNNSGNIAKENQGPKVNPNAAKVNQGPKGQPNHGGNAAKEKQGPKGNPNNSGNAAKENQGPKGQPDSSGNSAKEQQGPKGNPNNSGNAAKEKQVPKGNPNNPNAAKGNQGPQPNAKKGNKKPKGGQGAFESITSAVNFSSNEKK